MTKVLFLRLANPCWILSSEERELGLRILSRKLSKLLKKDEKFRNREFIMVYVLKFIDKR